MHYHVSATKKSLIWQYLKNKVYWELWRVPTFLALKGDQMLWIKGIWLESTTLMQFNINLSRKLSKNHVLCGGYEMHATLIRSVKYSSLTWTFWTFCCPGQRVAQSTKGIESQHQAPAAWCTWKQDAQIY